MLLLVYIIVRVRHREVNALILEWVRSPYILCLLSSIPVVYPYPNPIMAMYY